MDKQALKKEIRDKVLQKRKALDSEFVREASKKISAHFMKRFGKREIRQIHLFLSIEKTHEPDTSLIRKFYEVKGTPIAIPIVLPILHQLKHVLYHDDIQLKKNKWGIPEPVMDEKLADLTLTDIVIVPLLAFDKSGNRLGYGKGYYDAFLKKLPPDCLKIGLCFEMGFVETGLPIESHDVALNYVVTEKGIFEFA